MMKYFLTAIFIFCNTAASGNQLKAMLDQYCISCHGAEKQKGKVRLDNIDLSQSPKMLEDIIYVLEEAEMPPGKKEQPSEKMKAAVLRELYVISFARPGLKRLNREEYTNSVNDIFNMDFKLDDLLPEDKSEHGFNKIAQDQVMSPHQVQSYLKTARFIAERVLPESEFPETEVTFTVGHFRGSQKGDYREGDKFILATHYPWRSNLHFSKYESEIVGESTSKILCKVNEQTYERYSIPAYGTYRYEVSYEIINSKEDQVLGINLGDPRFPTNFKKIKRVLLPHGKDTVSFEVTLRQGAETSLTFDTAKTWSTGQRPRDYKGPKLAFKEVKICGPLKRPPGRLQSLLKSEDVKELTDCLTGLILKRALPVSDKEDFYMLAENSRKAGDTKRQTAVTLITAILCSPHFIYKNEKSGSALASKMSFFLWNTAADDSLLEALKNADKKTVREQALRMMADEKINRFYQDFTAQWLQTEKIDDISPDMRVYSKVTPIHVEAMKQEAVEFFKEIFEKGLSMENFIESDFIMINDKLAEHYGFSGVRGSEFRKFKMPPDSQRGGLTGQAGFLKQTSGTFETSPILRGVWIIKNLYGEKMEPPADVIIAEPDIRGTTTVREIMEKHQSSENCFRCHAKIDPLGLALEHFDAMGKYRKEYKNVEVVNKDKVIYKKASIDSAAILPNGSKANSLKTLKAAMLKDKEKIIKGIISKLISYATGNKTAVSDRPFIDDVYRETAGENFSLKAAVLAIVSHDSFLKN